MTTPLLTQVGVSAPQSIEQLAGNRTLPERDKVAAASQAFEALLLRQILNEAQKPLLASPMEGSRTASEVYRDMFASQLADQIAASGAFGLSRTLSQQLQQQLQPAGVETVEDPSAAGATSSPLPGSSHVHD